MPYIPQKDRNKFDDEIDLLICEITYFGTRAPLIGEVNYIFSKIIWRLFEEHPSYTRGNELVGVLECVKQEFIRRRLNGYEDEKILENGDL